ncbi:hypothetical protein DDP54_11755 [Cellulomonas sp. WB94]|uniref:hypothetical protein n=1 Tax=Cellulomonas sp. WB94 TaxID=2173174 RepID=UPI000D582BE8|nr:hypothetical protein [Cellulomonas sp. WB94]PVU83553.1 hypothetical protein DDP54_11755 [Cellulomonas sp. WB94]
MTDVTDSGTDSAGTTAAPGVVSVFLTTLPVDQLDRYRVPVEAGDDANALEADSGLVGVDVDVLEVDGFAEDPDDPLTELLGYSAGESFADAAALDLGRLRDDDHTGLVLVYDHDARLGPGVRKGSGLTLVGVYSYDWRV